MQLGIWEIVVILAAGLILVGPEKLPEIAKTVAKVMRDFRRYSEDLRREINQGVLGEARNAMNDSKRAIEDAIEETIEDAYPDASDFPGDGTDYDDYGTDYYGSEYGEPEEETGSEPEETEDTSGLEDESTLEGQGKTEPGDETVEQEYEDDYGND